MTENNTPLTAEQVLHDVGYDGFVRALFNRSGDPSKDLAHAVLGIVTEIYELRTATDRVNQVEEAGDLMFYRQALQQVVEDCEGRPSEEQILAHDRDGLALLEAQTGSSSDYVDHLCNILQDHAKRWVGYGKAPESLAGVLVVGAVAHHLTMRDHTLEREGEEVQLVNAKKLLKRYAGTTFNADKAINRDLAAERTVLEDAVRQPV